MMKITMFASFGISQINVIVKPTIRSRARSPNNFEGTRGSTPRTRGHPLWHLTLDTVDDVRVRLRGVVVSTIDHCSTRPRAENNRKRRRRRTRRGGRRPESVKYLLFSWRASRRYLRRTGENDVRRRQLSTTESPEEDLAIAGDQFFGFR